ncbi:hypothetical protein [Burkholderia ubonensis]|uniref:hypothetical protein n=1 Tax=Burkholderia ubonensis TaxID=101571 RepID=UPI000753D54F|nr:hypothetical protein [Burkholderia ubonensis]KVP75119.1 hypothetical protein WJ93_06800 [Burkholderia ubonensis]
MESLLYIAAFIGNVFNADAAAVVELLTGLSKFNARLVSLAGHSRHSSAGSDLSSEEASVYADAQNSLALFQKQTGINVLLSFNGRGPTAVSNSLLRLEFPGTLHDASNPLHIQSLAAQLQDAEEENWDLVREMMGYRVGLNLLSEHTEEFITLSESSVDYIEGKIRDGYVEGEFFESLSTDETDLRGYWKILN